MNLSTLIQFYSHSFTQAILGEDDFIIATGSSDAEEVQIKIWTPIKVINIATVCNVFFSFILPGDS